MRVALLCSGLGNIHRGHEVFALTVFDMLRDSGIEVILFKGGGEQTPGTVVVANLPRQSALLDHIHVAASEKWAESFRQSERHRIEEVTFAYSALPMLLERDFDVLHCLEREVCSILYSNRHLFRKVPRMLFSNGGALPKWMLPPCDAVQEYTEYNLKFSAKDKGFVIPHGVDTTRFHPDVRSDFRARHGIPEDAFVVVSVGKVSRGHKRMDYVIREVARLPDVYLIIVGEDGGDTKEVKELGRSLMGNRVVFDRLPHDELPSAYAAGNVFVLGSLFETFGIVYIEALAMGLPVVCTNHLNQRLIVKDGVFIDMARDGALAEALKALDRDTVRAMGVRSRKVAEKHYDLGLLRAEYARRYREIAAREIHLPRTTLGVRLKANVGNMIAGLRHRLVGRAE